MNPARCRRPATVTALFVALMGIIALVAVPARGEGPAPPALAETATPVVDPVVFQALQRKSIPIRTDERTLQSLVYDTKQRTIAAATDGEAGLWWRPGTAVGVVPVRGKLGLYDALARTWQVSDLVAPSLGAWSPDGSRFAFGDAKSRLHVLDMDAMTVRHLPDVHPAWLAWAPDGRRLAVYDGERLRVLRFRASGAPRLSLVAVTPGDVFALAGWLNSSRLAFAFGERPTKLRVVEITAAGTRTAAPVRVRALGRVVLSPDGDRLAVGNHTTGDTTIYRAATLTPGPSLQGILPIALSPGGERLLGMRDACQIDEALVAMRPGKPGAVDLGPGVFAAGWSPDGRSVVYLAGRSVYLVPSDGSAAGRLVFDNAHAPAGAEFSDNGRFLSFWKFFGGYGRCD